MKINGLTNILTKPRILTPTVFFTIGATKTCMDYYHSKPERKKRVLLKDTAILAGSLVGFGVFSPLAKMITKTCKFKKPVLKKAEFIIKQTIAGTLNTFGGIVGAIYANELVHKYVLNKPQYQVKKDKVTDSKTEMTKQVFKDFKSVTHNETFETVHTVFTNMTDLPKINVLSTPMIALTGFNIANTKGYHNKLKKITYELLANTMIPTIFISAVSLFVGKKSNKIKLPALAGAVVAGTLTGKAVADKYKAQIDDTIDDLDMKYVVVR